MAAFLSRTPLSTILRKQKIGRLKRKFPVPYNPVPYRVIDVADIGTRASTSGSAANCSNNQKGSQITIPPPPTWSVHELRLTVNDDPNYVAEKISDEELAILSRRCLIDIRFLPTERRERLKADVAGIMRCASVLLDAKNISNKDGEGTHLTDEEIYDAPRGLTKVVARRDIPVGDADGAKRSAALEQDDWELYASNQSKAIMKNRNVREKMIEKDGELFFRVRTK